MTLTRYAVDPSARGEIDLDTFIALYARTLALGIVATGQPTKESTP